MAVYSILPTTNLKAEDIRDTLADGGGSVSNDTTTFFKSTAKINWASKRKPVRYIEPFCQDFDSSKPNYDPEWWQSNDGNCGLTLGTAPSFAKIIEILDGTDDMNGWVYNLPLGGSTSPYRLGDFAGYSAVAKPMAHEFYCPEKVENRAASTLQAICMFNRENDSSLSFADFPNIKDYHFGIIVRKNNSTLQQRVISETTIGEGGLYAEISTNGLQTGTWRVYPFIAQNPLGQFDADIANYYYTLPMIKPRDVEIVASFISIMLSAEKVSGQLKITYEITVYNTTGTDYTFNNNTVRCRFATNGYLDALEAGEQEIKLADGLVAKGNTTTVLASGTFSLISQEVYDNPRVWYMLNSGAYNGSVVPLSTKPIE